MRSSVIASEEKFQLTKFNTYSEIIIKRFTYDEFDKRMLTEMVEQLVALAEYCFIEKSEGLKKKFNVKIQIQKVLENNKESKALRIADVLLDGIVEEVVKNNTKNQLIALAKSILKLATKAGGCLSSCFTEF